MNSRGEGRIIRKRFILVVLGATIVIAIGLWWALQEVRHQYLHRNLLTHACRENLKQLAEGKMEWAKDEKKSTNDIPTHSDLFGPGRYFRGPFTCPSGGTYTFGFVSEKPRCSVPSHTI